MINKYIVITIALFLLNNVLIWYQLNSQLVWDWAKGTKSMWIMSLLGIPISIMFWYATKFGYEGFTTLWQVRLLGFAVSMFDAFNLDHDPSSFGFGGMSFLFAFGFSAYFNKDIFHGRSPAKRILKMQVIDIKTGQVANPLKCLARNLTIVLWPLEVIFVLIDPKRRLGDKIAGTRIDYVENPEKTKKIYDTWVFSRDTTSSNPNWQLVNILT